MPVEQKETQPVRTRTIGQRLRRLAAITTAAIGLATIAYTAYDGSVINLDINNKVAAAYPDEPTGLDVHDPNRPASILRDQLWQQHQTNIPIDRRNLDGLLATAGLILVSEGGFRAVTED